MMKLIEQEVERVLRAVSLRPAYDTPNGIHNAELTFAVSRGSAAIEWTFNTGWYLKETRERPPNAAMRAHGHTYQQISAPDGVGQIMYHSPVAIYPDQSPSTDECSITHGLCFSGGSYLDSGELFDHAIGDPAAIWIELTKRLVDLEAKITAQKEDERNFS